MTSNMWVDTPTVEIAHPSTWEAQALNGLFDIKNALLDKLFMCAGKSEYQAPIRTALSRVEELINLKLSSDARGV